MESSKTSPVRKTRWYTLRWQFVLVIGLLAVVAWYFTIGRYRHTMGSGPAGPGVEDTAFQRTWSTNPVVLLGIGDSITAGFGATPKHSYFELLIQNDDATTPDMKGRELRRVLPGLQIVNRSVSYTISEEHLRDQLPSIKIYPTNTTGIVVITTGGNDLIHDYGRSQPRDGAMYGCTPAQTLEWKESYRGRLQKILEGVKQKFPGGCEIFLANIYDPTDGVGDIEHANILLPAWNDGMFALQSFNTVIAEVCAADSHVHLIDIHRLFLGHGIHCGDQFKPHYQRDDPHYWYFENLEDPNDRGYDAVRRAFLLEMVKVLAPAR